MKNNNNNPIQTNLFEQSIKSTSDGLIIKKGVKTDTLSKTQKEFNTLTSSIEKQQKEIEKHESECEELLTMYTKYLYPVKQKLKTELRQFILNLYQLKNNTLKKLKKSEIKQLDKVLSFHISEYCNLDEDAVENDAEIRQIIEEIEGVSMDEMIEAEYEKHLSMFKNMMDMMGLDIDLKDYGDTPKEIMDNMGKIQEKIAEQKAQEEEQFENREQRRKKSKKERDEEEKEKLINDAKAKNISFIYKQLAKLLHPDLEPDPILKLEKEELMKEVVVAYQEKNLHKLLQLELKWIQRENTNLGSLTDDKLSIYNEILRAQLMTLNQQFHSIRMHPRFEVINDFFVRNLKYSGKEVTLKAFKLEKYASLLNETYNKLLENDVEELKKMAALQKMEMYGYQYFKYTR